MLSFRKSKFQTLFNNFFINIGLKLANDTPMATRSFETYIRKNNETMQDEPVTINELKDALFSLKINKSAGYNKISFNVITIASVNFVMHLSIHLPYLSKKVFYQTI